MPIRALDRWWTLWVSIVVVSAVELAAFYPGLLSYDSVLQLSQAHAHDYAPWHPPLMAFVWHYVEALGPCGRAMVVAQVLVLNTGLALVVRALTGKDWPGWFFVIALSPTVFALAGTIWKDVHLAAAIALGTGCALTARGRWWSLCVAALCGAYACGVRFNGFAAVLPLVPAILALHLARRRLLVASVSVGILLFTLPTLFNLHLTAGKPHAAQFESTAVFDLIGMSLRTGENLLPSWLQHPPRGRTLDEIAPDFHIADGGNFFFFDHPMDTGRDDDERAEIRRHWVAAIVAHPFTYLAHRASNARYLLELMTTPWNLAPLPTAANVDAGMAGCSTALRPVTRTVLVGIDAISDTFWFRGWLWLVPSILVCIRRARSRPLSIEVGLAMSALAYTCTFFVASMGSDFRYIWWPMIVGLMLVPAAWSDVQPSIASARRKIISSLLRGHALP